MKNTSGKLVAKTSSIPGRLAPACLALGLTMVLSSTYSQAQTSEPYNWNNVKIGGGGFVSGLVTNKKEPTLMYARTDVGGAYRYDRTSSQWIPLTDWASDSQQGILGAESLASDPTDPKNLYILAGISYFNNGASYILRSSDYGATFKVIDVSAQFKENGNGLGRQNGEKLQVDPNKNSVLYCGTRASGLFKSTNYGDTWARVNALNVTTTPNNANGVSFVVIDKSGGVSSAGTSQRLFVGISRAGSNTNFYRSNDAGTTFSAIDNPGLPDTYMPQRAVLSGNGYVYITYGNGAGPNGTTAEPYNSGQIWRYTISSGAWLNVTPKDANGTAIDKAFCGLSVDPANSSRLVASTTNNYSLQGTAYGDHFYYTTDGGTNWTDVVNRGYSLDPNGVTWVATQSIHWAGCIEFDPSSTNRVFVTSGNGTFVNEDITSSAVWKFNVKGLEETVPLNLVSIPGGPLISVIGDYDGFRHTDVTQYAPIHSPRIGSTSGLGYAVSNKNKVARVGSAMYYSTDMGATWTKTGALNGSSGQVALSADGNTFLHSPNGSATTYRSTNNGSSWASVNGLSITSARPVADGLTNGKFYAYDPGNGNLLVSTNGGANFAATGSAPGTGGSKVITIVPGRDGDVWVALYGGGLTHTENAGGSWLNTASVTYCGAVGIGKAASGSAYETIYIYGTVGGVLGIHRSTDKGASWVRVNDEDHEYGGPANGQFIVGDMNTYGRVYMSTAGRGIVYGSAQGCTPSAITPYSQVNGGTWTQTGTVSLAAGGTVVLGPQPNTTSGWSWNGPVNYKATTREITLANCQPATAGLYTATYTNSGGCRSSYQFHITVTGGGRVGVVPDAAGSSESSRLLAFPNPVDTKLTVSVPPELMNGQLILTNANGVVQYAGKPAQPEHTIDVSQLPPGMYLLNLSNGTKGLTVKVLKK